MSGQVVSRFQVIGYHPVFMYFAYPAVGLQAVRLARWEYGEMLAATEEAVSVF